MRKHTPRSIGALVLSAILVVSLVGAVSGGGATPHKEENWAGDGRPMQNFTMHIYGDSTHQPGESEVSMWYEIVIHSLPEDDRRAWLNQSVTASPWSSACQLEDLQHFGIDRGDDGTDNGTGGGTQTYYQTNSDGQVTSVDTNYEQVWRGQEGVENYRRYLGMDTDADEKHKEFPLSTNGWDAEFVETSITKFWDKEQAESDDGDRQSGQRTTFEYQNMDRVIVDYQNCYTNPSEPGWYRQASLSETYWVDQRDTAPEDHRTGAPGDSNYVPVTYSHWVYICDCNSYDEAVNTLGEPPEMNGTKVENPDQFAQYYGQSSDGGDGATPTPTPGGGGATATPTDNTGGGGATATPTDNTNNNNGGGATATPTNNGGGDGQTPTFTPSGDGTTTTADDTNGGEVTAATTTSSQPGFGPVVALVAIAAAALLLRRRR